MVKVIGKDPTAVKQVTCKSCASILEYTESETTKKTAGDYSGDTWFYWVIYCPTCGDQVKVK